MRQPAFARLWLASSISQLGSQALFIAQPLAIYAATGSATVYGAVVTASTAGLVVSMLVGGALADIYDRRKLLQLGNITLIPVSAGIGVAVVAQAWAILVVLAFVQTVVGSLFVSAAPPLERDIVPDEHRPQATAIGRGTAQLVNVVSQALGAAVFVTVGFGLVAALDVVTFLASAGLLLGVRDPDGDRRRRTRSTEEGAVGAQVRHAVQRVAVDLRVGVVLTVRDRFSRVSIVTELPSSFANGAFIVAALPWLVDDLRLPSTAYGAVMVVMGVSGTLAAIVVAWRCTATHPTRMLVAGAVSGVLGGLLIAFSSAFPWAPWLAFVVLGAGNIPFQVGEATIRQRRYPSHVQGRMAMGSNLVMRVSGLAGAVCAGAALSVASASAVMSACGAAFALSSLLTPLVVRASRSLPTPVDPPVGVQVAPARDRDLAISG